MSNDRDTRRDDAAIPATADLSHLRPDRLRIGGVGVFAGDWAWTGGDQPRIPVGFVGTLTDYWNGWAVFRCTREVAEAIVADQERMRAAERARLAGLGVTGDALTAQVDEAIAPMWFDGDDLILDESAVYGPSSVDRTAPGDDGRYCVQGFHWTWTAVDPADCDRIAGVLPPLGEHQEYVIASHQPLRMPHDRLTVTAVEALELSTGIAYTATLCLDGQPVGTADNGGSGGPTLFHPAGTGFSRADMDAFVAGCRWRGREVSGEYVLEALITEYQLTTEITAAAADGQVVVILRDGDAQVEAAQWRLDRGHLGSRRLRRLAEKLTSQEAANYPHLTQFVWEVWTGKRWKLMGIVDMPRDGGPAGAR